MKYLTIETVLQSFEGCRNKTQNKFWGMVCIIKAIGERIVPAKMYSFSVEKVQTYLEELFRLEDVKKAYSSSNKWSVVFSTYWVDFVPEQMFSSKPNIYDVAAWFYRRTAFDDETTPEQIVGNFIDLLNLTAEDSKKWFSFQPTSYSFDTQLYSENNLMDSILKKISLSSSSNKTLSFEDQSFIKSNPGSLGQAPFVQTLYANQGIQKCLILTQFDFQDFYPVTNNIKTLTTHSIMANLPLQQIFYGAPGTGKSHEIKRLTKDRSVIRTTFHPDSDYSTFVGAYKPTMTEKEVRVVPVVVNNGISLNQNQGTYTETQITYRFVIQAFLKAYLKAWKQYADGEGESVPSYVIEESQPQKKQRNKDITVIVDGDVLVSDTSMADAGRQILVKFIELVKTSKTVDEIIKEWNDRAAVGSLFKLTKTENKTSNWEEFKVMDEDCYFYAGINGKDWPTFCEEVKELFESLGHQIEILKASSPSQTTNDAVPVPNDDAPTLFAESSTASDDDNPGTITRKPVFLVIEEINRGNCAQIFGDLFQLLDRSGNGFSEYPIEADTDLQQEIERAFNEPGEYHLDNDIDVEGVVENYTSNYDASLSEDIQHGRILLLPSNLYIWATMNTSDQSLFPIDSAFKRRWEWKYVPIVQGYDKDTGTLLNWDIEVGGKTYNWWKFLQAINKHIGDITKSEDKKLGFFFCKATNGTISAETFVGKVLFYLWNDVYKDYDYSPAFFRDENKRLIEFSEYYEQDSNNNTIPNDKLIQAFIEKVEPSFKTPAADANPN